MAAILAVATLLIGIAVILAGNGLLGTLLGIRGEMAGFPSGVMGLIMSGYFMGFVIGTFVIPRWVRRVGHIRMFAALASMASIITLMHGLVVQEAVWFALRLLAGFCVVGLYIVIESWLNEQTDNTDRGNVFYLNAKAVKRSLRVFVDNVLQDPEIANYTLDESLNAVVFNGKLPPAGSVIEVVFEEIK